MHVLCRLCSELVVKCKLYVLSILISVHEVFAKQIPLHVITVNESVSTLTNAKFCLLVYDNSTMIMKLHVYKVVSIANIGIFLLLMCFIKSKPCVCNCNCLTLKFKTFVSNYAEYYLKIT